MKLFVPVPHFPRFISCLKPSERAVYWVVQVFTLQSRKHIPWRVVKSRWSRGPVELVSHLSKGIRRASWVTRGWVSDLIVFLCWVFGHNWTQKMQASSPKSVCPNTLQPLSIANLWLLSIAVNIFLESLCFLFPKCCTLESRLSAENHH